MASVIEMASSGTPIAQGPSVTNWAPLSNTQIVTSSANETIKQIKRNAAGTLSNYHVRVSANTITAATTYRIRKNTANGNQNISVGSSTAGEFKDVTNTDSVAAGDLINVQIATGGTGTTISTTIHAVTFAATANTVQSVGAQFSGGGSVLTTQKFGTFGGGTDGGLVAAEADSQLTFRTSGVLSALSVTMATNTTTTAAVTITSRINGAPGNMTLSVAAGTVGIFQDLTHTDSVVSGDLGNIGAIAAAGGTGTAIVSILYAEFSTTNKAFEASQFAVSGLTQGVSVTAYYPWIGFGVAPGVSTESVVQAQVQGVFSVSNMFLRLRNNTVTATSTLNFRKNGVNANQTVSIGASTAGTFEDVTHIDAISATDEVNYQLVSGGTGSSLQISVMSMLGVNALINIDSYDPGQIAVIFDRIGVVAYGEI